MVAAPASLHALPVAPPPLSREALAYEHAYRAVARRYGRRTPGRFLLAFDPTSGQLRASLRILDRMLHPVAVSVTWALPAALVTYNAPAPAAASYTVAPSGGLAACILRRESSDGQTSSNIAQFQQSTWIADGGGRYAPTPSQASYAEQESVLNQQLAAGHASQWTTYDGC